VPLPPQLVKILREWKLACPNGPLGLAFPNSAGKVHELRQIVKHSLHPAMIVAGLVTAKGKPKYRGMHALRHAYASWCINRKTDGGLELPLKTVQARLGHSSIAMTADVYGHLFARGDDGKELEEAANTLLALPGSHHCPRRQSEGREFESLRARE
jgi:integrase